MVQVFVLSEQACNLGTRDWQLAANHSNLRRAEVLVELKDAVVMTGVSMLSNTINFTQMHSLKTNQLSQLKSCSKDSHLNVSGRIDNGYCSKVS